MPRSSNTCLLDSRLESKSSVIATLIILIIALLGLSAFFSGSETALYSLRHTTLEGWLHNGTPQQRIVAALMRDTHTTLITILLVTNFVNILASVLIAKLASTYLSGTQATLVAGVMATIVILIFGEVIPKTFAYTRPEHLAPKLAPIILFCRTLFAPAVHLIRRITTAILGSAALPSNAITVEEYESFININKNVGAFAAPEAQLLEEIMQLRTIAAVNVMVPRIDVLTVDVHDDELKIINAIRQYRHRRLPVVDGDLDNIVGVMDVKTYTMSAPAVRRNWTKTCLRKPLFVPELAKLNSVLGQLREQSQGVCFVVDEYGGIEGMLTVENILEEIVGEMSDEYDGQDLEITEIHPGHWRLNGLLQLHDLQEAIDIELPETTSANITGFITEQLSRMPINGDQLTVGNFRFVIRAVHRHRVLELDLYRQSDTQL
jgi:CBS domain containing-hemolysin-like protein